MLTETRTLQKPQSRVSAVDRFTGLDNGRRVIAESAAVGAIAFTIACVVYRVWDVARNVPFRYRGDGLLHAAYVRRMEEAGWYFSNDRLGAPFELDTRDFPLGGENVHWLSLKVLGWLVPNWGAAMNVYLLLTYALVAATAYFALRVLGLRRWISIVAALLYSFLPFHQWRGVEHLLRSGYYIVPLLTLAVIWVGRFGSDLTTDPASRGWATVRKDRVFAICALAVLAGGSDTQNAIYASLLIVLVSVAVAVTSRDIRPVAVAVAFGALAFSSLLVNNTPFLLNRLEQGTNYDVANRLAAEQESFSLRPAQLFMPVTNHRLGPLADLKSHVKDEVFVGEDSQSLGMAGSIGLAAVVLTAVAGGFLAPSSRRRALAALCGVCSLLLIAISASQGWSFILSIAGAKMLRTWNRTSTFIAFFALIGFVLCAEAAADRLRNRYRTVDRRMAAAVAAVMLTALGVLDQVAPGVAQTERDRTNFTADRVFYAAVEESLSPGAMVYQFPLTWFPEGGRVGELGDYEQLTAYLHTSETRWSAASMKGRPEMQWHEQLSRLGPYETILAVATAGFDGAVVYRLAYPAGTPSIEGPLTELVGGPTIVSEDRQLAFYDLRDLRDRIEANDPDLLSSARDDLLNAPRITWHGDLHHFEPGPPAARWTRTNEVELSITNPKVEEQSVVLSMHIHHLDPAARSATIDGPFGSRTVRLRHGDPVAFREQFDLPPGTTTIRITSDGTPGVPDGPDERTLALNLAGLTVLSRDTISALCSVDVPYRVDARRCSRA